MKRILLLFCLISFSAASLSAQLLRQHIWQERLILIFAPDLKNNDFEQQLFSLRTLEEEALQERRILIYQITPGQTVQPSGGFMREAQSEQLYYQFGVRKEDFTMILIGLDGRIKMRKRRPVSAQKILKKIDRMPIRAGEIDDGR